MDQKVTILAQLCLTYSSFSNHDTHTHWHTHTQRLCCWHHYYWVFYKTLQTTTPPNNTHTYMEYTNAHKWSKVTMPITEHRTMTNQVKSFDLGWSMHHIFTSYDWTCSVKKLCLVFLFNNSHLSILFCVRSWDKFRTFGCYLHYI
jgi:hypothetical protein